MNKKSTVYYLSAFVALSTVTGCGLAQHFLSSADAHTHTQPVANTAVQNTGQAASKSVSNRADTPSTPRAATAPSSNTKNKNKTAADKHALAVRKSAIKMVQKRLNSLGFSVGTPDGMFGQKTLLGLKSFQKKHHLSADGVIGKDTWAALFTGNDSEPSYPGHVIEAPQSVIQALKADAKEEPSSSDSTANGSSHKSSKGDYVNWKKPTGGTYPNLSKYKDIWIDVSLSKQRTYIKSGTHTIYTMIVSTGLNTPGRRTPTGTYHIQKQRGLWFYAPRFSEGAKYWVSFLNHGEYLFHSVPMNRNKQVIVPVAEKLGKPASHGCVHLSLADAKWFYYHIKTGTKVVIQK